MKDAEGALVAIEKGFDPSAVRLSGNVVGTPPFKGKLTHSGWRVIKNKPAAHSAKSGNEYLRIRESGMVNEIFDKKVNSEKDIV